MTGQRIIADIGGDLSIISQQDEEQFRHRQKSVGMKVSVGIKGNPLSGSLNGSRLEADSDYQGVQE